MRMVRIIMAQCPIFALTLPVFHPPFCLLNSCLPALPLSLFRLRNLLHWASHIPVHHHAEAFLLSHKHCHEGSDSPIRIFHHRSPGRYVPSVQHILFHARAPTMTCVILTYRPAVPLSVSFRHIFQHATHLPHRMDARTSHVITSR